MALDVCKKKCLTLRFRALTLVSFYRFSSNFGTGEEWYGIASGIISFRNNRVLDLCPKCIFGQYLKNEWTNFNKILHRHSYWRGAVWNCKWDNFIQKQHSYGP